MNLQFAHAPVHSPEAVREIIAEALLIAAENDDPEVPAETIFEQATLLLGARVSVAIPPQAIDLGGLNFPFKAAG